MKFPLWPLLTWAGALLICVLLAVLFSNKKWGLPPPDSEGKKNWAVDDWRDDQCEALRREKLIREPQNTWSNAGYLFAGIAILFRSRKPLGLAVGAGLCLLAFCSGMYHASVLEPWQTRDIFGVYFVLIVLIFYGIQSLNALFWSLRLHWGWSLGLSLAAIVAAWGMAWEMSRDRRNVAIFESTTAFIILVSILLFLVALLVLPSLIIASYPFEESFARKFSVGSFTVTGIEWNKPTGVLKIWFLGANFATVNIARYASFMFGSGLIVDHLWVSLSAVLLSAGAGFFFRLGDGGHLADHTDKFLCCPDSIIQAHAVWHLLSAFALLLSYDFFTRVSLYERALPFRKSI